ncbi:hypothetical protein HanXRQr2_Chr02g0081241 [Helianthus annuus]|uniref:Uncharacterized protein n=1 Tax=Helianthus annuus TaxID=4232 RepID=A0A9K3JQ85_HELAN|nr:hypothetical protein HanXRQr2_Chr02g0081241 [Helianthus annuus]KAJ0952987.1 hypothetical protein HanPSC8_Chr02g0078711 [Helianthus annuus]
MVGSCHIFTLTPHVYTLCYLLIDPFTLSFCMFICVRLNYLVVQSVQFLVLDCIAKFGAFRCCYDFLVHFSTRVISP